MSEEDQFKMERQQRLRDSKADNYMLRQSLDWVRESMKRKYVYNFDWLGRPIIQYPQDMVAIQELIWSVKPDLIIETGIAHGGSLVMSASMLAILDVCNAIESGSTIDPSQSHRRVLGLDIDIREHNRLAIEAHPMASRIMMIEGSSVDRKIIEQVSEIASQHKTIMVLLDSNHTHEHVLAELTAYAPLVSVGSYCVVFDTFVQDMPQDFFQDRPWNPGNNPKTAVWEYLNSNSSFQLDETLQNKLLITVAPDGFLKRVS